MLKYKVPTPKTSPHPQNQENKLGLFELTIVIISAMIAGGAYNIPQNMAANSAAGPNLIAWFITALGVGFLARMFMILSVARPDAKDGIYTYAELCFGRFLGFFAAWGYWLASSFANVACSVLLMATFNYFFPGVFTGGNNWWSILGGTVVIWTVFFICLSGVKNVAILNIVGTIFKIIPLIFFIFAVIAFFRVEQFTQDIWGLEEFAKQDGTNLGTSIFKQVSNSMLVTLWMYIGIEGAVVVSGEARSQKDVGIATIVAFLVTTVIYVSISIFPYGMFSASELGAMSVPSTARILDTGIAHRAFGTAGMYIMNIGVIISLLSAWVIWTVMLAELPKSAAKLYTFPQAFAMVNKRGAAWVSLLVSTIFMQAMLFITHFAENAWTFMLSVATVMFIPCYLLCIMYLLKIGFDKKESYPKIFASRKEAQTIGMLAGFYGVYLIYAAGLNYLLIACIAYTIGIPFFVGGRLQDPSNTHKKIFSDKGEVAFAVILILLGVAGLVYAILDWKTLLST